MRLLAVVEYFPPILGHDLRIFELTRRLPPDWDVRFLVTPSLRQLLAGTWRAGGPSSPPGRIAADRIRIPLTVQRLWRKAWPAAFVATFAITFLRCIRAARRAPPDIVIANYPGPHTGFIGYALSGMRSAPFLVDFCDDIAEYIATVVPRARGNWLPGMARRAQDFLIRRSVRLPVATSALREYAIGRNVPSDRIAMLPNGVDRELFRAPDVRWQDGAPADGTLRCFYGGSLEPWAGSSLLAEVARRAFEADAPVGFWIAGVPPRAGTDGLPPNAHHLGYLSKEKVADAIQKCDCVLVPLRPGHLADGTSPVKLFEGLAAGKPCICSRAAGILDVVVDGENGLLVDSFDPGAWLAAIERLAGDTDLRRRLATNARRTADRYDWSSLARTFDQILRGALA